MVIITLDEAKNYLRVDGADDNALITAFIEAAKDQVEKFTSRTLLTQTFELIYDSVGDSIEIVKSPLQEVTKIETISDAGVKTEVSSSIYDVDISGSRGRVQLRDGCVWPTHRGFASFIITVKAGYGENATDVPVLLRTAAFIALAIIYENRGIIDEGKIISSISAICWPYRIFRL
jgi:uncharacterized phiE125 gp8 family phage protein